MALSCSSEGTSVSRIDQPPYATSTDSTRSLTTLLSARYLLSRRGICSRLGLALGSSRTKRTCFLLGPLVVALGFLAGGAGAEGVIGHLAPAATAGAGAADAAAAVSAWRRAAMAEGARLGKDLATCTKFSTEPEEPATGAGAAQVA